jgi:hypothetical protein
MHQSPTDRFIPRKASPALSLLVLASGTLFSACDVLPTQQQDQVIPVDSVRWRPLSTSTLEVVSYGYLWHGGMSLSRIDRRAMADTVERTFHQRSEARGNFTQMLVPFRFYDTLAVAPSGRVVYRVRNSAPTPDVITTITR